MRKSTEGNLTETDRDKRGDPGSNSISLCTITFNEEDYIIGMLKHFYFYVDEIIMLDGGSTDATLDLIKGFDDPKRKIKLYIRPQDPTRFPANWDEPGRRNFTLSQATGDWILRADADERFDDRLAKRIRRMTQDKCYDVYLFPIYNFWRDLKTTRVDMFPYPWYPQFQPRLFRNHIGIRYCDRPLHNFPIHQGTPLQLSVLKIAWSDLHVFHYHFAIGRRAREDARGLAITKPFKGKHPGVMETEFGLSGSIHDDAELRFRRNLVQAVWEMRRRIHRILHREGSERYDGVLGSY